MKLAWIGAHPQSAASIAIVPIARAGLSISKRLQVVPQLVEHPLARSGERSRSAESHLAEERHRQELALRQGAAHVLEPGRHDREAGDLFGQIGDARLQLADLLSRAS